MSTQNKISTISAYLGAVPLEKGTFFRVWAPKAKQVEVVINEKTIVPLEHEPDGYFAALINQANPGDYYKFRLNKKDSFPDPCSRFQPKGPHGPSMIINPQQFKWHDDSWQKKGIELKGQVIYEVHIGTYTQEGTYAAFRRELAELKELGITLIEIMPLAEFPGKWNWGYDGVGLFAPAHVYGSPDELRQLIDEAHRLEIGVVLDVVYNHFGPDGNYLKAFSEDYFTDKHKTDWGEAINFDAKNAKEVRRFFIENALYWINEFHFDGLRLDATQNIYDSGKSHILTEIVTATRASASPKKLVFIGENESQDVKLIVPPEKGGFGIDTLWNDDFHHTAQVAMTGHREAYYTDYMGRPQEFISAIKHGFLYQGQFYKWQNQNRGTFASDHIDASQFVIYLQNHDQIANSLLGERITSLTAPGIYRALTVLLLLAPQTPLLFMGQEFAASSPFWFFADHNEELAPKVFKGRKEFLAQFPSIAAAQDVIIDPKDERLFYLSKLKLEERQTHKEIYELHKDLLKLRRTDPVFKQQDRAAIEGAVLDKEAFVLRYKGLKSDRLLIINLGADLDYSPCPEPLLAPFARRPWKFIWSSEEAHYGGKGIIKAHKNKGWFIPAQCAQIFSSGDD